MTYRRLALAAILGSLLAACGTSGAPLPSATPRANGSDETLSPVTASPTPAPTPASPSPTQIPTASPKSTPKPTPVPVPPKPSGVKFDEQARLTDEEEVAEITQTITWQAPRDKGVEIRVYGVTECIAEPANPSPDTGGPCLLVHTPLPASVRTLLATAPASDGAVSWRWTEDSGCRVGLAYDPDGPPYHSIVLAAYDRWGHSIFAIAEPGRWWQPGVNDIVC